MSTDEKPTVEIAAVPSWAVDMTTRMLEKMGAGLSSMEERLTDRLTAQDTKLDKVVTEGIESNTRLTRIEVRMDGAENRLVGLEDRIGRTSSRVQQSSEVGLAHDAQLAQERAAREELAKKVDGLTATQDVQLAILSRLDKITSNPTVKVIAGMVATALLTWLASHGGSLK